MIEREIFGHVVDVMCMDFVHLNGTNQCVDPCVHYTELNEDWRSTNVSMGPIHCDQNRNWQGWYRFFLHNVSARIPEYCVKSHSCGTHAPLWIQEPHPTQTGIIVTRTVCNTWSNSCCFFNTHNIQVKRCPSNYFVYKLAPPTACSLAYCAEGFVPVYISIYLFRK
uniref:UMOD/GP2/OIT3-like D8C domain-containing protein n=1 Tax=Gouania willdenowi TaxID=441366 RepID=A0A8C5E7U3_GOUWI